MSENKGLNITITRKDKIYASIIAVLVCLCVVLAIVLPRPYKIVEVDKPRDVPVYQTVYETKYAYLLSPSNSEYDGEAKDDDGNVYYLEYKNLIVDAGSVSNIKVSLMIDGINGKEKKTITLNDNLVELITDDNISHDFGVNIMIDGYMMDTIKTTFANNVGVDKLTILDHYLFEIEFEYAKVNILVAYLSE